MQTNKVYWENIYRTKKSEELSWTEETPVVSLSFIEAFHLPSTAMIIDVGGGESKLVDCLWNEGYENLTVLDIAENSIERAKIRLGEQCSRIKWITQDILNFQPNLPFDCWHDRAAFHFLTNSDQIRKYAALARQSIKPKGYLVIGGFSESGPPKCSELPITRYSPSSLAQVFSNGFERLTCMTHDHLTPFKTIQSFLYCSFQRV